MNRSRRTLLQGAAVGLATAGLQGSTVMTANAQSTTTAPEKPLAPSAPNQSLNIINFDLLEQEAKKAMTPAVYAFIAHASADEWTMRENRRAFNDFPILPHRLAGVSAQKVDLSIDLLGHRLPFPIVVAPMGAHMFAHPDAEVATASGAGLAGTLYESSGASNKPLEDIAKATPGPKWFQLYFNADLGVTRSLLQRARDSGYSAIILTADALGPEASDEFIRLGRPFPPGFAFGNHDPQRGGIGNFRNQKIDLTPDDIGFIRSVSGLPVIIKGVLRGVDADVAIKAGASAIQVSNHGGRQLDGVPGAISVLGEVVKAVNGRVPVLFDSGIRRGIDVFRALALGARAVAVGRPALYGLAMGGALGVQSVIEHLRDELRSAMLLAGARSIGDLSPAYLRAQLGGIPQGDHPNR